MYLEPDAVRLHRNTELESNEQPAEEVVNGSDTDESQVKDLGDPRLIDGVPFEQCAHETFSEEFCVPSRGNAKTKSFKRQKNEGDIKRQDLEYLCETILAQEERRGYWEIHPVSWADEPRVIFSYESVALHVQGVGRELIR